MANSIKISDMVFDDAIDQDGELQVCLENIGPGGVEENRYMNREEAKNLIAHLQKVFEIKVRA